jgi:hypothetical protein
MGGYHSKGDFMDDERRKKLANRLTPIQLYQLTPKTNCGECGHPTCLAYATQVIVGHSDMDACPYLDPEQKEAFRARLEDQHADGIGVKREGFDKALEFLRSEVRKWDFPGIAGSLGAVLVDEPGEAALRFSYFGRPVILSAEDVTGFSGEPLNPWEKILLYNYVIGGAAEPAGRWVGMESLPNSISKIKSLNAHCEAPLARAFAGRLELLPETTRCVGPALEISEQGVDFGAQFQILPKLSIRVLWWDEDTEEGFSPRVKFLFDASVLKVLDLESLLFACEQLTDRLLDCLKKAP